MSGSLLLSTLNGIRVAHANAQPKFSAIAASADFGQEVSAYLRQLGHGAWGGYHKRNGLAHLSRQIGKSGHRLLFWNFFCPGDGPRYFLSPFPSEGATAPTQASGPGQLGVCLYQKHPDIFAKHNLRSLNHAVREASRLLGKPMPDAPSCLLMYAGARGLKKELAQHRMHAAIIDRRLAVWLRQTARTGLGDLTDEPGLLHELAEVMDRVNLHIKKAEYCRRAIAKQLVRIVDAEPTVDNWAKLDDLAGMVIRYLAWVLWSFPGLGLFVYVPGTTANDSFLKMGCSIGFEVTSPNRPAALAQSVAETVAAAEAVFFFTIQEAAFHFERCRKEEDMRLGQRQTSASFAHELKRVSANLANLTPDPSTTIGQRPLALITIARDMEQYQVLLPTESSAEPLYGKLLLHPDVPAALRNNIGLCFYPQGVRDIASLMGMWCQATSVVDLRRLVRLGQSSDLGNLEWLLNEVWSCSLRLLPLASNPVFAFSKNDPKYDNGALLEAELTRLSEACELAKDTGLVLSVSGDQAAKEFRLADADIDRVSWLGRALLAILRDYVMHNRPPCRIEAELRTSDANLRLSFRSTPESTVVHGAVERFAEMQNAARQADLSLTPTHTKDVVKACMGAIGGTVRPFEKNVWEKWELTFDLCPKGAFQ